MDGGFQTIFSVADKNVDWVPAIVFGTFVAVSVVGLLNRYRFWLIPPRWFFAFALVISVPIMISVVTLIYLPLFQAQREYRNGEYSVVEGYITNFQPLPTDGHGRECFVVSGQRFCYSDFHGTPGFNHTSTYGGPLHSGLFVRIGYRGNMILLLEVRSNDALGPPSRVSPSVITPNTQRSPDSPKRGLAGRMAAVAFFSLFSLFGGWLMKRIRAAFPNYASPPRLIVNVVRLISASVALGLIGDILKWH